MAKAYVCMVYVGCMHACSIKNANLCQKYKTSRQKYVWAYVAYAHVTNPWNENSSSSFCGRNVSCQISHNTSQPKMDDDRKAIVLISQPLGHFRTSTRPLEMKNQQTISVVVSVFPFSHYYLHYIMSILFSRLEKFSKKNIERKYNFDDKSFIDFYFKGFNKDSIKWTTLMCKIYLHISVHLFLSFNFYLISCGCINIYFIPFSITANKFQLNLYSFI